MNIGTKVGILVGYKPKAPLLAKNARNGAPSLFGGRSKISWTSCRIRVRPFDHTVKAGQPSRPRPTRRTPSQEEDRYGRRRNYADAEKEGWRNRDQKLRTACSARNGVLCYGESSDDTGCRDDVHEDGPNRPIPDGRPSRGNSPGAQCGTGLHFARCRGPGSWTSWFRNSGQRHERLRVYRGTLVDIRCGC